MNGYKTAIGVVISAIGSIVSGIWPEHAETYETLRPQIEVALNSVAGLFIAIGLIHKAIKAKRDKAQG